MEEVKDVHGFWNFTENHLLDGLYSEEWYNEGAAWYNPSTYSFQIRKFFFRRSDDPSGQWKNLGLSLSNWKCPGWSSVPHRSHRWFIFFYLFFPLPKMFTFEDRGVLMENRLIGLPRLRQLKVTNSSCNIPKDFRGIIRRCYSRLANASILLFIFAFYIQVHSGRGRQAGFWAGR